MKERPVVAILVGHYLPGSKAGGPIRSVANLVRILGDEFDFRVIAKDRDLGDENPYPDVTTGAWVPVEGALVCYLTPERYTPRGIAATLNALNPDLVYAQSYFSPLVSILPRVLRRIGRLRCPLLIAPRGEFSPGALGIKRRKKRAFLSIGRLLRLDRGVIWHATAAEEAEDIRRILGESVRLLVAPPPFTADSRPLALRQKRPGELEIAFVSRISPKKNLLGAIEVLAGLPGVRLSAYGPKESMEYWTLCQERARETGVALIDGGTLAPSDVRGAFEQAHLFLFPTLGENYGHVIAESLTAGTPVLLSDQTPWRDLQIKGVGWDLALENLEGFRRAVEEMRAMDEHEFAVKSRQAYEYARARSQESATVEENRTLLRRALESGE